MSAIQSLLHQPAAQVMGWALLHFVWQGALVGGLTAIALAALRSSAADVRYVVSTIGLSLMLTLPAVTATQLWRSAGTTQASPLLDVTTSSPPAVAPGATGENALIVKTPIAESVTTVSSIRGLSSMQVEPWLPLLVLAWLCAPASLVSEETHG